MDEFFPVINGKKRGSVTYIRDRENELSNILYYISEVTRACGKGTS